MVAWRKNSIISGMSKQSIEHPSYRMVVTVIMTILAILTAFAGLFVVGASMFTISPSSPEDGIPGIIILLTMLASLSIAVGVTRQASVRLPIVVVMSLFALFAGVLLLQLIGAIGIGGVMSILHPASGQQTSIGGGVFFATPLFLVILQCMSAGMWVSLPVTALSLGVAWRYERLRHARIIRLGAVFLAVFALVNVTVMVVERARDAEASAHLAARAEEDKKREAAEEREANEEKKVADGLVDASRVIAGALYTVKVTGNKPFPATVTPPTGYELLDYQVNESATYFDSQVKLCLKPSGVEGHVLTMIVKPAFNHKDQPTLGLTTNDRQATCDYADQAGVWYSPYN